MDRQRYRRLNLAVSFSLFIGCVTSRCSGAMLSGFVAAVGFLVFVSLVFFLVDSSPKLFEAIATRLSQGTGMLFVPGVYRRMVRRAVVVCLPPSTLVLPFRFQIPPPTQTL